MKQNLVLTAPKEMVPHGVMVNVYGKMKNVSQWIMVILMQIGFFDPKNISLYYNELVSCLGG